MDIERKAGQFGDKTQIRRTVFCAPECATVRKKKQMRVCAGMILMLKKC